MILSARFGLVGIGALALLSGAHWLRGSGLEASPAGDFVLGVIPNFAAAIAFTFVLLGIWGDQNPQADYPAARRAFAWCALIGGGGIMVWELVQMTSARLVFDLQDIVATLAGIGFSVVAFRQLTRRPRADLAAESQRP